MKLLLADDDRTTRLIMRRSIKKWGYEIVEADNGKTALEILTAFDPPRIALLDWVMPEMEGVQVCFALSAKKDIPLIYCILVTSKQDKEDIVFALDSGAHDFLSKPVNIRELKSRIAVGEKLIQSEDDLKESQRKLSTLMSNLPGMAYRCAFNPLRPLEFVSSGSFAITGAPADEWMQNGGKSYSEIIHPSDRELVWNVILKAVHQHRAYQCTYRIQLSENQTKWMWEQGRGIFETDSEPSALEGFITDITERKRLEESLAESQKMEAIARLAGGIAHDFNNYFMIIRFYTENLLKSITDNESMKEDVKTIQEIGQRASSLSKNLLAFSQNQSIPLEEINIHSILLTLGKTLTPLLKKKIRFEIISSSEEGIIRANPGQIEQIIMNLVLNARDAIEEEGSIIIRSKNLDADESTLNSSNITKPCVKITVEDSGAGISEDEMKLIFEPFYTTKEGGNETGLGLSIVFGIVNQLGGFIDVQSEIGKGTTITLILPRIGRK